VEEDMVRNWVKRRREITESGKRESGKEDS